MGMASKESFQPQPWACRLGFTERWLAEVNCDGLRVSAAAQQHVWSALDTAAEVQRGWFWSRVVIQGRKRYALRGFLHENAEQFIAAIAREKLAALNRLQSDLQVDHDTLAPVCKDLVSELHTERYLAARDRERIAALLHAMRPRIEAAQMRVQNRHAQAFPITEALIKVLRPLQAFVERAPKLLADRNRRFIDQELLRWRNFFDHCEERPLTDEQARAAITFEENTLLVAAAGSGKTSTVVGKVAYALAKGIARPEDILCLAFNGKAAEEIGERLKIRLKAMTQVTCPIDPILKQRLVALLADGTKIESRTFHSLGLKIIHDVEPSHAQVSKDHESKRRLQRAIERCQRDPQFATRWLLLQTVLRFAQPPDERFRNEKEYLEYLRGIWRQRKFGRKAKGDEGILSLGCTKLVRSFEEMAISNWLYLMGVEFEYEVPYVEGAALLCPGKTWTPDFTYRVQGSQGERIVVHEHFALSADGKAPRFFRNPLGYVEEAKHKQAVLRQMDVRHFWTTSADYRDGTLFNKLEHQLTAAGVRLEPRATDDVLMRLKSIGQSPDIELINRAVSQIRQNGWDKSTLEARLQRQPEPARARLFLEVVWPVAEAVKVLLGEDKCLDYDEMIRRALGYLHKEPTLLPFKLVLADEFQDTAPGRGELVRKILHAREDSLFFAVGDDWQAINRFAGSDLRFFNEFGQTFNRRDQAHARCDLTRTFRSNQGIADVARHFVLKNKSQMSKEVHADDKTRRGVIDVQTYLDDTDVLPKVEETLDRWVAHHPVGKKPSVFLLGRYSEKHAGGLSGDQIKELNERWADRIELHTKKKNAAPSMYLTMHTSKGLQADYVLIVGLFGVEHDWFCFPSEREDDPLLQLVLPPKETLADADERRLFYVALTRAKHQVVVLAQKRHPSTYALELLREHRDGTVLFNGGDELPPLCPACKSGLGFLQLNPKVNQMFYACSDRWGCGKTWPTGLA